MTYAAGIDITVVNFKTPYDLHNFLGSLSKFPPSIPWEAWIANVSPQDADRHAADDWHGRHPDQAHHISFEENVGYARAANSAIRRGRREYVAVFNADIMLSEDAIDQCIAALDEHPDWGICGPRQIDDRGRLTASGIFGTVTAPKHRSFHDADVGQWQDVRSDAIYVAGSALFTRRSLVEELSDCPDGPGDFLLPTPHFYEESWACLHGLNHGYLMGFVGTTTITHLWHRASPVGSQSTKMEISKEMFRAAAAHHGLECE